jgi:hypothetical protein
VAPCTPRALPKVRRSADYLPDFCCHLFNEEGPDSLLYLPDGFAITDGTTGKRARLFRARRYDIITRRDWACASFSRHASKLAVRSQGKAAGKFGIRSHLATHQVWCAAAPRP